MEKYSGLSTGVSSVLEQFVKAAAEVLGPDLTSVVLFGSAAEGRLRLVSDINLMLVLKRFDQEHINQLRQGYRSARAAVQLSIMFLLERELPEAAQCFPVKFCDILLRHRILYGADCFASLSISEAALKSGLMQNLLNLRLRLRERYSLISLREEKLVLTIAEAAGPLRASALALLHLQGESVGSPKVALQKLVAKFKNPQLDELLELLSRAREEGSLEAGEAQKTLLKLIELTELLDKSIEHINGQHHV